MIPLIVIGALLAIQAQTSAYDIYSTNQTTKASDAAAQYQQDFYNGSFEENTRFWNDYLRKHHITNRQIKYPYGTGYNYNLSGLYGQKNTQIYNNYSRYGSYIHGANNIAHSQAFGYYGSKGNTYVPQKNYTDVMYG